MKKFFFLIVLLALGLDCSAAPPVKRRVRSSGNPILPEFHADPEVMFSHLTNRFYIYSTTDGMPGWGGYYFTAFSSPDLVEWKHEGIILDLATDQVPWASGNAWAPAIMERLGDDGRYRYYFYYSGHDVKKNRKSIGVAIAEHPAGPFYDFGQPIIDFRPEGLTGGQQIDVDVFNDPITDDNYIYWGNGYMAVAKLNDDMVSIDTTTVRGIIASGDIFVSDRAQRMRLNDRFGALACEMEGAAIGHVCYRCGVPFAILRAISDDLNENKGMDFMKFCALASEKTVHAVKAFIEKY